MQREGKRIFDLPRMNPNNTYPCRRSDLSEAQNTTVVENGGRSVFPKPARHTSVSATYSQEINASKEYMRLLSSAKRLFVVVIEFRQRTRKFLSSSSRKDISGSAHLPKLCSTPALSCGCSVQMHLSLQTTFPIRASLRVSVVLRRLGKIKKGRREPAQNRRTAICSYHPPSHSKSKRSCVHHRC